MDPSKSHSPTLLNGHTHDARHSFSSPGSSDTSESSQASPITRKSKLEKLASKTKQATKRLFVSGHQQHEHRDLRRPSDPATRVLKYDPAFNPTQLESIQNEKGLAAKVQTNLQTVAAAILHPKEGVKGKATRSTAGRLSRIERPYISKDMDIEILEAHDNLSRAQSVSPSEDPKPSNGDFKEKVEKLEAQRESLRAAHTLSRYVQRVRVVPKRHIKYPKTEYFVEQDDESKHAGYDWLKWIGHPAPRGKVRCKPALKPVQNPVRSLAVDTFTHHVDLKIAFLMDMRSIYRWE
ncbi:MAG: hypothetical protein L6R42_001693 [Xanthoria sp. 1 TBL-2021]|nr:MAG: hypothetical protein L6R42_001693 [Xanthoria sp. 1 TBL-2021]